MQVLPASQARTRGKGMLIRLCLVWLPLPFLLDAPANDVDASDDVARVAW